MSEDHQLEKNSQVMATKDKEKNNNNGEAIWMFITSAVFRYLGESIIKCGKRVWIDHCNERTEHIFTSSSNV